MRHVLLGLLVTACSNESPPRGQVLLYFDTDAPVPPAAGRSLGPDDPIPIFDTLRVEIYEPGASSPCANCTREFALDVARMSDCSIGIIETPNTPGWRVRARMFRAASVRTPPDPPQESSLTVVASLPPVGETGIVERTLLLRMADFGVARGDLQSPVDTVEGKLAAPSVGSWPRAKRVPCVGEVRADEVCIRGGTYWMGNLRARNTHAPNNDGSYSLANDDRLRLVTLGPFFMMRTEVTVGMLRQAGMVAAMMGSSDDGLGGACTFTLVPGTYEDRSVDCVTQPTARSFCTARGGDLPTEAQFELVASGLQGHGFVWGEDQPSCTDAIWGRRPATVVQPPGPCAPTSDFRPTTPGRGMRDVLTVDGVDIVDLMGNVREWTRDAWQPINGDCWSANSYVDPVCATSTSKEFSIRGGGWDTEPALAATRSHDEVYDTGFRCVRSATR